MRIFLAISTLTIAGVIIFWQPDATIFFWQDRFSEANTVQSGVEKNAIENGAITADKNTLQATTEEPSDGIYDDNREAITEDFIPNPEAVASMRQARLEGDSRAPQLAKHHEREVPTAEELGDHEQYLEYERRQQKRVYRAYVDASKIKTAQLRSMIEQGKTEGISAEELEFAENKIRGIEEMALTLQQDYPDIMDDSYQPPADWLIENLGKNDSSIKTDESKANIAQ
jgi:hypothetical protein